MRETARDAHEDPGERRRSGTGLRALVPARGRRRPGARGVHHHERDRDPSDGARPPRAHRRRDPARDRRAHARLSGRRDLLRREARRGRRAHRGRLPSATGDRAALRLQDQRVRRPARRILLRAEGGESDDRIPRRLALRARGLSRGLRARVPRAPPRSRGDGPRQRDRDDPVLPQHRRGGARPAGDGAPWTAFAASAASRST